MATEAEIKDKWAELLDYAKQHATGEGLHRGYNWLRDAFNEYIIMSDEVLGYGMGGAPGSKHNREVLAEKICLVLGNHVLGQHLLNEEQEAKLKKALDQVVSSKETLTITR